MFVFRFCSGRRHPGVLLAFEDRGYDSQRVLVGGLERGAIGGTSLRLREFLAHCSPHDEAPGALLLNAAYADPRLDGKRSARVENLCRSIPINSSANLEAFP